MKSLFLVALAAVAAVLAACGGGGSSPIGGGVPATPAPIAYQAQIVFKGALAGSQSGASTLSIGRSIQSMNQRGILAAPGATPVPIMVVSPMTASDNVGIAYGVSSLGGAVDVVVSPMPSSTPQVTFASTNPNAVLQTPAPNASPLPLPANAIAQQLVGSNPNALNAQSAGSITATVGSPISSSPSTAVYTYAAIDLLCAPFQSAPPGTFPAFAWNGTSWVGQNVIVGADIYLSGPQCTDAGFQTNESQQTIHFPGGGATFSTDTPFAAFTASQWTNIETSIPVQSLDTMNPDGSFNSVILFKTASGAVAKIFPVDLGIANGGEYGGAIEVSGDSIDGF